MCMNNYRPGLLELMGESATENVEKQANPVTLFLRLKQTQLWGLKRNIYSPYLLTRLFPALQLTLHSQQGAKNTHFHAKLASTLAKKQQNQCYSRLKVWCKAPISCMLSPFTVNKRRLQTRHPDSAVCLCARLHASRLTLASQLVKILHFSLSRRT